MVFKKIINCSTYISNLEEKKKSVLDSEGRGVNLWDSCISKAKPETMGWPPPGRQSADLWKEAHSLWTSGGGSRQPPGLEASQGSSGSSHSLDHPSGFLAAQAEPRSTDRIIREILASEPLNMRI